MLQYSAMSYCRCWNSWQKFKECFTGAGETSEGLLTTRTLPLALEAPPAGSWTKALQCYCPVYKLSPGTGYCWRLGTARGIAVLPKIAGFMFLFLPQEATGDHNERLRVGNQLPGRLEGADATAQLGSSSFPLNSVSCIHSKHLKNLNYFQTSPDTS